MNNTTAKRLREIMEQKKSNLCVAADVTTCDAVLRLADAVGPAICVLKTHVDILTDFSWNFVEKLLALAQKHNFLLFEDRKFADIGNTVKLQYASGIYRIAEWADIVNAHIFPGPGVIEGLKEIGMPKCRGMLLIAEMSSAGNIFSAEDTATALAWAKEHNDFVIGFIAVHTLPDHEGFVVMTPGVSLEATGDALGQQYILPKQAVANGADIIIVGRGITGASDPAATTAQYRADGWKARQEK